MLHQLRANVPRGGLVQHHARDSRPLRRRRLLPIRRHLGEHLLGLREQPLRVELHRSDRGDIQHRHPGHQRRDLLLRVRSLAGPQRDIRSLGASREHVSNRQRAVRAAALALHPDLRRRLVGARMAVRGVRRVRGGRRRIRVLEQRLLGLPGGRAHRIPVRHVRTGFDLCPWFPVLGGDRDRAPER